MATKGQGLAFAGATGLTPHDRIELLDIGNGVFGIGSIHEHLHGDVGVEYDQLIFRHQRQVIGQPLQLIGCDLTILVWAVDRVVTERMEAVLIIFRQTGIFDGIQNHEMYLTDIE